MNLNKLIQKAKEITAEKIAIATALTLGATGANAAFDVTAVTSAGTDVAVVGAAVFAVYVAVKLFKWGRAAL